jgi:hypothetical protein
MEKGIEMELKNVVVDQRGMMNISLICVLDTTPLAPFAPIFSPWCAP